MAYVDNYLNEPLAQAIIVIAMEQDEPIGMIW